MKFTTRKPRKSEVAGAILGAGLFFYIGNSVGEENKSLANSDCTQSVEQNSAKNMGVVALNECQNSTKPSADIQDMEQLPLTLEIGIVTMGTVLGVVVAKQARDFKHDIECITHPVHSKQPV